MSRFCIERESDASILHSSLVILTSRANWFHTLILGLSSFVLPYKYFYTLGFNEDYAAARQFYKCVSRYAPFIALAGGEARAIGQILSPLLKRELSENQFDITRQHPSWVVGTGLNMPDNNRKMIIINMTTAFKPASAYWYCKTIEEVRELSTQDLISCVQQNLGRNMRRSHGERRGCPSKRVALLMNPTYLPGGIVPYIYLSMGD